ncbi:helix-turn-helix domain-containing protein [Aminipila sp.]|uniref:helix-turn-helix domain-containing protein n=1 Tax=Aminipila sp. TaxID=2060095 RepID=UPI0028975285|nr:helix-turn-helix transcriptional regulator [Aminipila sp.]
MFNFGEHLKDLRKSKNITQKQLAQHIKASERGIQNYELNERKPTYDILIALADYFDVPIDYLVGRANIDHTTVELQHHLILPEKKEKLLKIFDTLDTHNQGALLERAEMLLETQKENNMTQNDALTPQKGA